MFDYELGVFAFHALFESQRNSFEEWDISANFKNLVLDENITFDINKVFNGFRAEYQNIINCQVEENEIRGIFLCSLLDFNLFELAKDFVYGHDLELVRDNVKVCWKHIGEGMFGDYDCNNPDDVPLLRFYVNVKEDETWKEVEDTSYCTKFPSDYPIKDQLIALHRMVLREFYYNLNIHPHTSNKELCQDLSHISVLSLINLVSCY